MTNTTSHHAVLSGRVPRLVAVVTAGLLAIGGSIVVASPAFAAVVTVGELEYVTDPVTLEASVSGLAAGSTATDIVIPGSFVDGADTYTVTSISSGAFSNGTLTSVVIGNSVVTIGGDAFRDNAALVSVTIGESVVTIDSAAFSGGALTSLVIPDSVETIGSDAFRYSALMTLTLGASVETIGGAAFMDATLAVLALPDSLVSIGGDAFRSSMLASLVIPNSVVSIGNNAFLNNPLTSLTLGSSLETIGDEAFRGHQLPSLVVPASVTDIGYFAFSSSPDSLTSVIMQGAAPSILAASANGSFGSSTAGKTVYYPLAFATGYTSPWEEYTTAVGASIDFDLGGNGSAIAGVTVIPGQSVPAPPAPAAPGFTFGGWYTASDHATPFDFGAGLEAGQTTAYAQWISQAVPGAPGLAATGVDTSPMVWTGALALLFAGSALILMRRRGQLTK